MLLKDFVSALCAGLDNSAIGNAHAHGASTTGSGSAGLAAIGMASSTAGGSATDQFVDINGIVGQKHTANMNGQTGNGSGSGITF
jgi:hypothetical protein